MKAQLLGDHTVGSAPRAGECGNFVGKEFVTFGNVLKQLPVPDLSHVSASFLLHISRIPSEQDSGGRPEGVTLPPSLREVHAGMPAKAVYGHHSYFFLQLV